MANCISLYGKSLISWAKSNTNRQSQVTVVMFYKCVSRDSVTAVKTCPSHLLSPLRTNERRLEEGLWAAETLVADGDDLAVGQLVALLQRGRGSGGGHFILKVQSHVAQLLLDISNDLAFSWKRLEV